MTAAPAQLQSVSGVQLAQGVGVQEAKGFWVDAWSRVLRRPAAVASLVWLSIVAFLAVFAPLIASGHPLLLHELGPGGVVLRTTSPFLDNLTPPDVLLLAGVVGGVFWLLLPTTAKFRSTTTAVGVLALMAAIALTLGLSVKAPIVGVPPGAWQGAGWALAMSAWAVAAIAVPRAQRGTVFFLAALQAGLILIVATTVQAQLGKPQRELPEWMFALKRRPHMSLEAPAVVGLFLSIPWVLLPVFEDWGRRIAVFGAVAVVASASVAFAWDRPLQTFDYAERATRGEVRAVFTLVPFSPTQSDTRLYVLPPGATVNQGLAPRGVRGSLAERSPDDPGPTFILGTDPLGQDVLTQLLHACRLSISIGLVSTGIAVLIGVTIGALMGYFGGWVDLALYRVVEVFMAIPVLFLLIVAAAVLPRSTYVMMGIIGCVTWTGAARFTRAEFLKLRNQDFVQSARAVGLPLKSILFKHMLPNGVTPVLVDSSFAIAAAILAEATLSYLGLGPDGQPSWGKLLSSATGVTGTFVWWLAIFPGLAIFLTVLSYNLIGESLRDAIDPKLKKARV